MEQSNIAFFQDPVQGYKVAQVIQQGDQYSIQEGEKVQIAVYRNNEVFQGNIPQLSDTNVTTDRSQIVPADTKALEGVHDLCLLSQNDIINCSHNILSRYFREKYFTQIGNQVLVYLKPNIFSQNSNVLAQINQVNTQEASLPKLVENLRKNILAGEQRQNVILNGASGSGKTYLTRQLLNALTQNTSAQQNIETALQALEYFTNCVNEHHVNTSRAVCVTNLGFNQNGELQSLKLQLQSLERNRLIYRRKAESSFHIFYYLFADQNLVKQFQAETPEKFTILNQSLIPQISALEYENFLNNLRALKITEQTTKSIFQALAGILYLGNITFETKDGVVSLVLDGNVQKAANLLEVSVKNLGLYLCTTQSLTNKIVVYTPHQENKAKRLQVGLIKFLYTKLVKFVLREIQQNFQSSDEELLQVSVYDILGFELFQGADQHHDNYFDQLMINFQNEVLHQQFQSEMSSNQDEYIKEQINWEKIEVSTNQNFIDYFKTPKTGIFNTFNDSTTQEKKDTMLRDLIQKNPGQILIIKDKDLDISDKGFNNKIHKFSKIDWIGFRQTYGPIVYKIDGLVQRNAYMRRKDQIQSLLLNTTKNIVFETAKVKEYKQIKLTFETVKATSQMEKIKSNLVSRGAVNFYIRCVNVTVNDVNNFGVMRQLYAIDSITKLIKNGFQHKYELQRFLNRFQILGGQRLQQDVLTKDHLKSWTQEMLKQFQGVQRVEVGNTKVFLAADAHTLLISKGFETALGRLEKVLKGKIQGGVFNKWRKMVEVEKRLKKQINEEQERLVSLERNKLNEEVLNLNKKLAETQQQLAQEILEKEEALAREKQAQAQIQPLREHIQSLEVQLVKQKRLAETFQNCSKAATEEKDILEQELGDLQEEKQQLEAKFEQMQKELNQEINNKLNEIESLKTQLELTKQELIQAIEASSSFDDSATQIIMGKSDFSKTKEMIKNLETSLQEKSQALETAKKGFHLLNQLMRLKLLECSHLKQQFNVDESNQQDVYQSIAEMMSYEGTIMNQYHKYLQCLQ